MNNAALQNNFLVAVTFLLCLAATYGGIADGAILIRNIIQADSASAFLVCRDWGISSKYVEGWVLGQISFLFPNFMLVCPTLYLSGSVSFTIMFYLAVCALMLAGGWALLAKLIFGATAARFAVLAIALHLILWAHGGENIFGYVIGTTSHRNGTWFSLPWLLWLTLKIVFTAAPAKAKTKPKKDLWQRGGYHALLTILLGLLIASDLIIVIWFVAPTVFMILMARLFAPKYSRCAPHLLAILFFAYIISVAIKAWIPYGTLGTAAYAGRFDRIDIIKNEFLSIADFLQVNPILSIVWLGFILTLVVLVVYFLRNRKKINFTEILPIFWIIAAMGGFSVINTVLAHSFVNVLESHALALRWRYKWTALYLPLFIGWVFVLPLLADVFSMRKKCAQHLLKITAGFAVILSGLSIPKIYALSEPERLAFFNTPFFSCMQQVQQKHDLSAGISDIRLNHPMAAGFMENNINIKEMSHGYFYLKHQGKNLVLFDNHLQNFNYGKTGFDFVVVNGRNGKSIDSIWDKQCRYKPKEYCPGYNGSHLAVFAEHVLQAVGQPVAVETCDELEVWVYDTPIYPHNQR